MASELEQLATSAGEVADAADGQPGDLAERASRLAERLSRSRFNVSVLGEFKRGKSTFINAMLGDDVLPTGVLPLTAVATEVAFGERGATVVHTDGRRYDIKLAELADFVTEERNPENQRQVARVEVRVPVDLLEPGVVLVDTPGIGSIYRHNDEAARQALLDADGAILVLSADSPLSEQERELLGVLAERQAPTFFVLNKIDHLSPGERDQVRRFVADGVAAEVGRKERLWCLSAREALSGRRAGHQPAGGEAGEFAAFAAAFTAFVGTDLVQARLVTARHELARLGRALDDAVSLEAAALALDAQSLTGQVRAFEKAAAEQRQAFEDERTLLARDAAALNQAIATRLSDFARRAPSTWFDRLEEVAATTPVGRLERELSQTVEAAVREGFESFRQAEEVQAEQAWEQLAERFRARTQARVNAVREAAAGLFAVSLPDVAIPEVAEERERFFYLFLHIEPSGEAVVRALRRLLPPSVVRRQLLAGARSDLAGEFDKHAGRARWDLSQRLDAVRRRFEVAMAAELTQAIETIIGAAHRAEELRQATDFEQKRQRDLGAAARRAALRALAVAEETA